MLEQLASSLGFGNLGEPPQLTSYQRMQMVLDGQMPDRVPVCFWHHFQPSGSGRQLARQTVDFFVNDYDLDIVKVMPDLPYPFPHKSIQSIDGSIASWRRFSRNCFEAAWKPTIGKLPPSVSSAMSDVSANAEA